MKSNRVPSINFILWLSFLLFAAFIILITWVFQTSFLKLFLSREAEDDLDSFGANAYMQLKKYMAPGYDDAQLRQDLTEQLRGLNRKQLILLKSFVTWLGEQEL